MAWPFLDDQKALSIDPETASEIKTVRATWNVCVSSGAGWIGTFRRWSSERGNCKLNAVASCCVHKPTRLYGYAMLCLSISFFAIPTHPFSSTSRSNEPFVDLSPGALWLPLFSGEPDRFGCPGSIGL